MSRQPSQRKLRNWLLQPDLQVRLGFYSVLLGTAFSMITLALIFYSLSGFFSLVVDMVDSGPEVQELFFSYLNQTKWWLFVLLFVYFLGNMILSIYLSHRLVGPTKSFQRHIERLCRGDYDERIVLRKNDAFGEVADSLNRLTEILKQQKKS